MANWKLTIIFSTFVLCYMATTTTKIVSFEFCMEVNGQLECYDMYSGRTGAEFPANENFFGVQLNELANPNFQSVHYGGFLFSISLNVNYLQIVNVTSREQKAYKLNFHPLALHISHNYPDSFHLFVIGVNLTGKCDEQSKLIFHYVTFSISNCHDNGNWPCPSSYYKLISAKNCSEQIPLIALSPDVNRNMVLLFEKSASDSLFCYSLTSYDQCGYPLDPLPQDYSIIAYHPYHEGVILQIKYDYSKYKCYSFGYEGFNELPNECPANAKMVTPQTFRSTVSGTSILYRNKTPPGRFEQLNDVIGDPVEIKNGLGLVYVSGRAELTVKGPGLFGGKQTLATQDPICKDAHNNALLLAIGGNGKQLTVLLCPENQFHYLQSIIQENGTYSLIPIHEKSVIKSNGPISMSFFLGIVEHQAIPRHPSTDLPTTIATPIIIFMILFLVVALISGTVFPIACYQCIRRRRNYRPRNSSRTVFPNENFELLPESERSSQANLIHNVQVGIQENDEGQDVVQMPLSDNEQSSQLPLDHEERGNENVFVNESFGDTAPSTQQMTVPSSYENEGSEPGNDRRELVEPASTQNSSLQDITTLGSGGQRTITAPLNVSVDQGGKEPLVPDLHPALTTTDPLQGNTVHEYRVECTLVSPPTESASNRSALLVGGELQTDELHDGSIGKKAMKNSSSSHASTRQMTVQSSYDMESHGPASAPGSKPQPTLHDLFSEEKENTSHQRELVGSDHEDQLQFITGNTPITHGEEDLPTSQQVVEVGGVSHFDGLVVSRDLLLTFPPREDVNVGSDDGSSDEYTRELREGAEGYRWDDS